jgi:uncharacterized coiled-coil protein SlyX
VSDTKAMEEALQMAVAHMARQQDGGGNGATNPLNLLAAVLPKLLANDEEREDLVEKLEGLEKETFAPLQEQILGLRKQVHRVGKLQEAIIAELQELREQQTAVGNAVLHLAEQMSRVGIVEDQLGDDYDDLEPPPSPPRARPTYQKKRRGPL